MHAVSLSLLRTLRANGVDLNGAPPPPPLDEAEAPTSSPALSAEEDEEGADDVVAPHKRRFPHLNPLQAMIFAGAFPSAWRLLVSGVDPDFPSLCKGPGERERENTRGGDQDFGRPAVHLLCDLGARILDEDLQTGALRLLLKHGATVNLRDRSGKTPLETLKAAVEGQKQRGAEEDPAVLRRLVRLLVEFGARPWECFIPGWQPPTGIHAHLKQFNVTLPQQGAAGAGAVPLSPVMETFRLSMTAAQKGWETRKYALPGAPGVKALEDEWPIPDWGGIRTGHVMQTWTFMSMDSTEGAEVVDWFWGAWVKDAATKACMTCIAPFDAVSRRRHHCQ
uniref:Uncharacterized protein n=1 Tax=Chromera velia CCMP2878 TaxID=1169474 RepID=A0A0K6S8Y0_9ALVE|eukprot:Cvel_25774.t1-p1 / transcript=Cvel_25774.t1 / gene=Cvel_25774 / organism=Chromera_velia_CCMP2878 / gene_product=hypothetical protein / transcript_product=hypothetical protein / location=Cvel_scaffold2969:11516-12804(-) / protein_length=335 / sequence_SO=supercontig / SO=protein_coding / is_pseudo=false